MSLSIIYPSLISTVSADEEHANYPDDNILTRYPEEIWKATSTDAKVTFNMSSTTNAMAVFNSNSSTISSTQAGASIDYDRNIDGIGSGWMTYTDVAGAHAVSISFDASSTVYCGVAVAGESKNYDLPLMNVGISLYDYSELAKIESGGFHVYQDETVRTFQIQVQENRISDFYTMMHDIFRENGLVKPLAWRISDADWEWIVYARFQAPPMATHITRTETIITINLIEEI